LADAEKQAAKKWPYQKRNMLGGFIHGVFFQLGMAFSQSTSVLPAFIHALTGSSFLVGLLSTLQRTGTILPQLFFANYLESKPLKRPYLLWVIYSRSAIWAALGFTVMFVVGGHPTLVTAILLILLTLFFFVGGLGELVYSYMIARTIAPTRRGSFFGIRSLLGGLAGIGAGFITHKILLSADAQSFTGDYGLLFLLTGISIAIAGFGFLIMREPADGHVKESRCMKDYLRESFSLVKKSPVFRRLLWVIMLLMGTYLSLPFYVVFARVKLGLPDAYIGFFITLQIIGQTGSGVAWGWMGDRWGYRFVLICVSLASLLPPLWAIFTAASFPDAFAVTFALIGISLKSVELAVRNYLLEISPDYLVPTCLALKNTLTAPTLFFPLVGGLLINFVGYQTLFLITAGMISVGALLSFYLPEPRNESVNHETGAADL